LRDLEGVLSDGFLGYGMGVSDAINLVMSIV
jgi:hypothetical protein